MWWTRRASHHHVLAVLLLDVGERAPCFHVPSVRQLWCSVTALWEHGQQGSSVAVAGQYGSMAFGSGVTRPFWHSEVSHGRRIRRNSRFCLVWCGEGDAAWLCTTPPGPPPPSPTCYAVQPRLWPLWSPGHSFSGGTAVVLATTSCTSPVDYEVVIRQERRWREELGQIVPSSGVPVTSCLSCSTQGWQELGSGRRWCNFISLLKALQLQISALWLSDGKEQEGC